MRTAAQRRYAEKNRERLRSKDKRRNHHNPVSDSRNRNQRNSDLGWLWMKWGQRRQRLSFDYDSLSILNLRELENPTFIFVKGNKRCLENLHSLLPAF